MLCYHGTPIGSVARNRKELIGRAMCLSYAWGATNESAITQSALDLVRIASYVLLDCGAFTLWRRGCPYDYDRVCDWYRMVRDSRPCPEVWLSVLIPDVIDGGQLENDARIDRFPADLAPFGWPVWHTEEPLERLRRLAAEWGRVAIGAMGRHRAVTGPAYTARMVEMFNGLAGQRVQIHMLRGLRLAGGPFPFDSADSTDVGRNWSQTTSRLRFALDRWDRRAALTARSWHPRVTTDSLYCGVRQVTICDYLAQQAA